MSQAQLSSTQSDEIDRPVCPKCGSGMWMIQVDHKDAAHDRQTFKCPVCEDMKSNGV